MKQMKNRWFLLLSLLLVVSLVVSFGAVAIFYIPPEILNNDWNNNRKDLESSGLEASAPRIFSGPSDGSVFHGERNVTPGYGQVVHEVWTPGKPWGYYNLKIGINATGYGEVAFTLNGNTSDYENRKEGVYCFSKVHTALAAFQNLPERVRPSTEMQLSGGITAEQ